MNRRTRGSSSRRVGYSAKIFTSPASSPGSTCRRRPAARSSATRKSGSSAMPSPAAAASRKAFLRNGAGKVDDDAVDEVVLGVVADRTAFDDALVRRSVATTDFRRRQHPRGTQHLVESGDSLGRPVAQVLDDVIGCLPQPCERFRLSVLSDDAGAHRLHAETSCRLHAFDVLRVKGNECEQLLELALTIW